MVQTIQLGSSTGEACIFDPAALLEGVWEEKLCKMDRAWSTKIDERKYNYFQFYVGEGIPELWRAADEFIRAARDGAALREVHARIGRQFPDFVVQLEADGGVPAGVTANVRHGKDGSGILWAERTMPHRPNAFAPRAQLANRGAEGYDSRMGKREKLDPAWHKARVAARILLKAEQGKLLSPRDKRLARLFAAEPGVTNRLLDHARSYWRAPYTLDRELQLKRRTRNVVVTTN